MFQIFVQDGIFAAGAPRWMRIQVKSLCQGPLNYQKVSQALLTMFGGDHKPSARDLFNDGASSGENSHLAVTALKPTSTRTATSMAMDYGHYDDDVYHAETYDEEPTIYEDDVPEDVELRG